LFLKATRTEHNCSEVRYWGNNLPGLDAACTSNGREHRQQARVATTKARSAICEGERPTSKYASWVACRPVRMSASLKGFGRRPFAGALGLGAGPASESLVRRKPRGGRGAVWLGASYGDLKVADGSRVRLRGLEAAIPIDGNVGDERVRSRAYEGPA
jgi:hypothetical protein